jgi:hypothetical protein
MASPTTSDPELRALQEAWAPAWHVWRARRTSDPPGIRRGDFVASRMDDAAGPHPTVMQPTAGQMDTALREQRELAASGMPPPSVGCLA